ncbi:MAG: choice-of-anchor D domain-containing protein [Deltaproteobacteria bacterium]|nr:MAG: choice-of-anchor D domain-containing protein [Deltaproteobacteria bacterium]
MTRIAAFGGIVLGLCVAAQRAEAAPGIEIYPSSFSGNGMLYDGGFPGEQQYGFFSVNNTGTTTLTVTDMAFTGPGAALIGFDDPLCGSSNHCAQTFTVAPGAQAGFSVTCTAMQPGTFAATLTVTSDAASGGNTVALPCKGFYPPVVEVSPPALDFGTAHGCWYGDQCGPRCNTRPATQTLTLTNTAPDPSEIDLAVALPMSGPYWDFTIDAEQPSPFILGAGQSVNVTFTFHPMSPNGSSEYLDPLRLTAVYPAALAPIDVPFHARKGWGQLAIDTPPFLGNVAIGQTLVTTITVHDAGDSCLQLAGVWSERDITVLDGGANMLLQAGESRTWTVSCTAPGINGGGGNLNFDQYYDDPDTVFAMFDCQATGGGLWTDPAVFDFDSYGVGIGTSVTVGVTVFNPGDQPTDLVALTSSDPHFRAAPSSGSLPVTLAPGDSMPIDITFSPSDAQRVTAAIRLDASTGSDYALEVSGAGIPIGAGVTPASHDFGAVAYPTTPSQGFTLQNTGDRTLTVTAVSLDLPADYTITGLAAGATLAPGATLGFDVRANAAMLGQRRALAVTASDSALTVTTGDATPTDYALELGSVDVDTGPRTGHVTLYNASAAAMTLASCDVTGDAAFALTSACPPTIAAGAGADLAVAFSPNAEAEAAATLTIGGAGFATGALRIGLHGRGFDQHVALSATSVAFPDTFRHPTSAATRVVTVRNTGTTELALPAISVDGAGFALVGPASATLAAGGSADITVRFSPSAIGVFTGHLVLGNTDDPRIARIDLSGRGIARDVAITPLAIDLGTVAVGATLRLGELQPGAIAIRNADPAASFTITGATLSGDAAFHLIGPDRTVIAPGEVATLDLEVTPTVPGALAGEIAVFSDGDPEPVARLTIAARAVAATGAGGGCCSTGGSAGSLPLALGVLALLRRRR